MAVITVPERHAIEQPKDLVVVPGRDAPDPDGLVTAAILLELNAGDIHQHVTQLVKAIAFNVRTRKNPHNSRGLSYAQRFRLGGGIDPNVEELFERHLRQIFSRRAIAGRAVLWKRRHKKCNKDPTNGQRKFSSSGPEWSARIAANLAPASVFSETMRFHFIPPRHRPSPCWQFTVEAFGIELFGCS